MRAPIALLATIACAACADGEGFIEGARLEVPDCKVVGRSFTFEPFRMELASIAVQESDDVATLRIGSRAGSFTEMDQLGIVLYDVDAVRTRIAAQGEAVVDLVLGQDEHGMFTAESRQTGLMTLALLDSCRHTTAVIAGVGRFVVTAYSGAKNGDLVAGRLEVDLIDRRTGLVLGAGMRGELDFVVDTSAPNAAFAPRDY